MVSRFETPKFHSIKQTELQKQTQPEYLLLIKGVVASPSAQRSKASYLLLPGVCGPFLITGVRLLARKWNVRVLFVPREVLIAPLYHPPEGVNVEVRTLHSTDRTREKRRSDDFVVLHLLRRGSGTSPPTAPSK